ncbi:MAG: hypothetical protein MJB57_09800 [Gemmatimonadetes bacterium]|nr:hypothetical protein [Gemmatimonadota bacterium]
MAYTGNKEFDKARDRLFQEIHRCDVIGADAEDVAHWLDDTMQFLAEEFPSLNNAQRRELRRAGENYAAPPIPHGEGKDATNRDEWSNA